AVDESGWRQWVEELGPAFRDALQAPVPSKQDEKAGAQQRKMLEASDWAFATIAPRGIGPTRWAELDSPEDKHIRRLLALLGQTLYGQRGWDVRRGLAVLRALPELKGVPLWLEGTGNMAGVLLYAAVFEPDAARLELRQPPADHRDGPI